MPTQRGRAPGQLEHSARSQDHLVEEGRGSGPGDERWRAESSRPHLLSKIYFHLL